jgi:hypothetical protein
MSDEGKFLPISDAMARDLDNGKADNRALDDFLPDSVLQSMKDAQDAQGTVHAEDLVPISKAEAARRTMFDGEHLPAAPATRRVIPAPYRRDRVIGGKHGKKWNEVRANQILKGDIIPDVGLVTEVEGTVRYETRGEILNSTAPYLCSTDDTLVAVGTDIHVTGAGGNEMTFDSKTNVRVFR